MSTEEHDGGHTNVSPLRDIPTFGDKPEDDESVKEENVIRHPPLTPIKLESALLDGLGREFEPDCLPGEWIESCKRVVDTWSKIA